MMIFTEPMWLPIMILYHKVPGYPLWLRVVTRMQNPLNMLEIMKHLLPGLIFARVPMQISMDRGSMWIWQITLKKMGFKLQLPMNRS